MAPRFFLMDTLKTGNLTRNMAAPSDLFPQPLSSSTVSVFRTRTEGRRWQWTAKLLPLSLVQKTLLSPLHTIGMRCRPYVPAGRFVTGKEEAHKTNSCLHPVADWPSTGLDIPKRRKPQSPSWCSWSWGRFHVHDVCGCPCKLSAQLGKPGAGGYGSVRPTRCRPV